MKNQELTNGLSIDLGDLFIIVSLALKYSHAYSDYSSNSLDDYDGQYLSSNENESIFLGFLDYSSLTKE